MWYVEVFESFKICINLVLNLLPIYLHNLPIGHIVRNLIRSKSKKLIWKFQSYVAFWKGLGHDLMN
jgi:hypothetical protein